jgi:GT2 family glycosyltransferase
MQEVETTRGSTSGLDLASQAGPGMKPRAKIGIVTVTYDSGCVLGPFLRDLSRQSWQDFVLYAVDNASRDGTLVQLRQWDDARLALIANQTNVGVAEADNQGIRMALKDGCHYVLLLNNDVEFEPDTLATLVSELNAFDCDLIAPKILYEDRVHIWSAGGVFEAIKGYHGSHRAEGERDDGRYDTPMQIRNAPGCCILARSDMFAKVGMIDPKYFVYHEDADLLYRAWRAGLTMYYTPRARIFHKVSALTGGSNSAFTVRYNARGHVYFMLKNLGPLRCAFFLPALQLRMVMKMLRRTISWGEFMVRERAFFEGIGVWLS